MIKNYIKPIFKEKFSILSKYDSLSNYNYEIMKLNLSSWQHYFIGNDDYLDAEWNDGKTRIKIRYQTSTGAFIQILEEEWIEFKMIFVRINKKGKMAYLTK